MRILLDENSVAQYIGQQFDVTADCVLLDGDQVVTSLNTSNTSVIDEEPPQPPLGNAWKWQNSAWVCINQDAVDAYNAQQTAAFNRGQAEKRHAAYVAESDPIFFKWQRQEATQQEWLDKIAAIDARYPYQV